MANELEEHTKLNGLEEDVAVDSENNRFNMGFTDNELATGFATFLEMRMSNGSDATKATALCFKQAALLMMQQRLCREVAFNELRMIRELELVGADSPIIKAAQIEDRRPTQVYKFRTD